MICLDILKSYRDDLRIKIMQRWTLKEGTPITQAMVEHAIAKMGIVKAKALIEQIEKGLN